MNLDQVLKSMENTLYESAIRNCLLTHTKDTDLQVYLELSEKSFTRIPDDALENLNQAIKNCKSTGIKYLLMIKQLGMTRANSDQSSLNRKIYLKLIKEFGNIPHPCRKLVAQALKFNKASNIRGSAKAFRTWSQNHTETDLDITIATHAKATGLLGANDIKASEAYYQSYQRSLKQPDPVHLMGNLNNAAVCILKTNPNRAAEISKELTYYAGVYGESHQIVLIAAGTLMQVAQKNRDYERFFEAAVITDYFYEILTRNTPPLRNLYRPLFRLARKHAFIGRKGSLNLDEVSNTKTLREFLKEKIGRTNKFIKKHGLSHTTVYRVLNGESPVVLIKTLKQLINALEIELSFNNPKEINYVLKVMEIEEQFEKYVEKLLVLPDKELTELLIGGIFITLPNNTLDYRKLFSLVKDREGLLTYLKKDYSRMLFINRCFHVDDDFYKGRQMLFNQLIEQLDVSSKREMITLYTSLKTNEKIELLSRYFREYSRVSAVNPDSNVEGVLEKRVEDAEYKTIISFCERMKIGKLPGYLCTWFFEEAERAQLLQCFD